MQPCLNPLRHAANASGISRPIHPPSVVTVAARARAMASRVETLFDIHRPIVTRVNKPPTDRKTVAGLM